MVWGCFKVVFMSRWPFFVLSELTIVKSALEAGHLHITTTWKQFHILFNMTMKPWTNGPYNTISSHAVFPRTLQVPTVGCWLHLLGNCRVDGIDASCRSKYVLGWKVLGRRHIDGTYSLMSSHNSSCVPIAGPQLCRDISCSVRVLTWQLVRFPLEMVVPNIV